MTSAELEQLWQQTAPKIVSAEITTGPGALAGGGIERAPRVIAMLDDGRRVELFSFSADRRAFNAEQFVGLTVDEGRRLKFAANAPPRAR